MSSNIQDDSPTTTKRFDDGGLSSSGTAPPTYDQIQRETGSNTHYPSTHVSTDSTLPPGWESYLDNDSGDRYYYNIQTTETTWIHPRGDPADFHTPNPTTNTAYPEMSPMDHRYQQGQSSNPNTHHNQQPQQEILDQNQLDSIPPETIDFEKYTNHGRHGLGYVTMGVMKRNKFLTFVSLLLLILFITNPSTSPSLSNNMYRFDNTISQRILGNRFPFFRLAAHSMWSGLTTSTPSNPTSTSSSTSGSGYGDYGGYGRSDNSASQKKGRPHNSNHPYANHPRQGHANHGNGGYNGGQYDDDFPSIEIITPLEIIYVFYLVCFVFPAGAIPLTWFCGGGNSCCLGERVIEAVKATTTQPAVYHLIDRIDTIAQAQPHLWLTVECSHQEEVIRDGGPARSSRPDLMNAGSRRHHYPRPPPRFPSSSSSTFSSHRRTNSSTPHQPSQHRIVTYRAQRPIPILRWRDISPPSLVLGDIIDQCSSSSSQSSSPSPSSSSPSSNTNHFAISYDLGYRLHPSQDVLLGMIKDGYKKEHSHRDSDVVVGVEYRVGSPSSSPSTTPPKYKSPIPSSSVDVYIKNRNNFQYYLTQFFIFNPFSAFIWFYLGLFFPFVVCFHVVVNYIPFTSTKYLHINYPNHNGHDDVVLLDKTNSFGR